MRKAGIYLQTSVLSIGYCNNFGYRFFDMAKRKLGDLGHVDLVTLTWLCQIFGFMSVSTDYFE